MPSGKEYLAESELKARIKSKNLAPCYLLFGEEHYLIRNYLEQLTAAAGCDDFDTNRFDGAVKIQDVYDAAVSFPVLSPKRVVMLCDYPFEKAASSEIQKLYETIGDLPATTVLILWFETISVNPKKPGDKFLKLAKELEKAGGSVCYVGRKSQADIMKLLQSGAARRGCRLDVSAARYMIETCSDDLNTLINELEKLCLYAGEGENITQEMIDKICSRSVEAGVYNLSKTLLRGDVAGACRLLNDLFYTNTEPEFILSCLASTYIDLYRVFAARAAGKRPETIAKDFGYFATAFRLTEADRQLKNFSEKKLQKALSLLSECDRMIKESRCDSRTLLEKALVELNILTGEL